MKGILRRIWYLLNRRRMERELADEMAYHRELMAADRQHDFGGDLRLREDAREVWGWAWLDRLCQDLTYGSRILRNSPGFTITAMLVLALGIGVPLTAYRQMLYDMQADAAPDPDTLVHLTRRATGLHITMLPYPALTFYAANAHCFREVIGLSQPYQAIFGETKSASAAEQIRVLFATANYFPEFGIACARGRLLTADDERPDSEAAALVGELFWEKRLGGDPGIIGRKITVNGKTVRVAGVVSRSAKNRADVWMTLARQPYVIEGSTLLTDWNSALEVYGRLSPGISPQASEQETRALGARLHELRPTEVSSDEYLEARPINELDHTAMTFTWC